MRRIAERVLCFALVLCSTRGAWGQASTTEGAQPTKTTRRTSPAARDEAAAAKASSHSRASTSRPSTQPSKKPAVPLDDAVAVPDSELTVRPPRGWERKERPTPDAALAFMGPSAQSMVTLMLLPPEKSKLAAADAKAFAKAEIDAARSKPNNNPRMKPILPPTQQPDASLLLRWHDTFTIAGVPGEQVHLYRLVGGRVVYVIVGLIGNVADRRSVDVAESVIASIAPAPKATPAEGDGF
jgi:hypothetical protein